MTEVIQNQFESTAQQVTVAAVVVTLNRLDCLRRCVGALEQQTHPPDQIIVVDNGSTDGTPQWLASKTNLRVIRQGNLGSGGGQHTGMKAAYDAGFDFAWCMDDDGFPAQDALATLLEGLKLTSGDWLNCLVVDQDDPSRAAFPHRPTRIVREIQSHGLIYPEACPFNGTLIPRKTMDRIGFPSTELFIWGEEFEYMDRAKRAGILPVTVTHSIFYHPASLDLTLRETPLSKSWKFYYHVRNAGATVDRDGTVHLNGRQAWQRGLAQWRSLLKTLPSQPLTTLKKAWMVLLAVQAAKDNYLIRRYP